MQNLQSANQSETVYRIEIKKECKKNDIENIPL